MRELRSGLGSAGQGLLPQPDVIWGAALADVPTDPLVGAVAKVRAHVLATLRGHPGA